MLVYNTHTYIYYYYYSPYPTFNVLRNFDYMNNQTENKMSRPNYDEKTYMNLVDLGIAYPDEWDYYFFKDNGYYYNH